LLKLIVSKEYCESLVFLQNETLSDHLQKLLECEIKGDQEPITVVIMLEGLLTSADRAQVTFAQLKISQ
jgi:hypothetical protein